MILSNILKTLLKVKKNNKKPEPVFFNAGEGTKIYPEARFYDNTVNQKKIQIGKSCWIMGEFLMEENGFIEVGDFCYVGPAAKIWSILPLRIGNRVLISHGVNIHDNDSHSLSAHERHDRFKEKMIYGKQLVYENKKSGPIVIEDDVWIGFNATLLKGVTVGRGAVIGAGAVITKDVAPYSVVVGNPQRVVGKSYE